MFIVGLIVGIVAGGLAGLLVGRSNKKAVEALYQEAKSKVKELEAKVGIK